jgi:hypothetical protein
MSLSEQNRVDHMTETQTHKALEIIRQFRMFDWRAMILLSLTLLLGLIIGVSQPRGSVRFGRISIQKGDAPAFVLQEVNLSARVQAVVQRLFGTNVDAAADRSPYYVIGDFNDDRREDLLVLVRVKGPRGGLPKEVSVLNPWHLESTSSNAASVLALAVVHGSSEGWDTLTPSGRFLLADKEFFSTPIWEQSAGAPISLMKKHLTMPARRVVLPKMAKGDAVGLGTEAGIDIVLYWDGKTYRIYEPKEEP